jgi:hypothetical protein
MGMMGGFGKDIPDDSFGEFPGMLILFLYHPDLGSRPDFSPVFAIHRMIQLSSFIDAPLGVTSNLNTVIGYGPLVTRYSF